MLLQLWMRWSQQMKDDFRDAPGKNIFSNLALVVSFAILLISLLPLFINLFYCLSSFIICHVYCFILYSLEVHIFLLQGRMAFKCSFRKILCVKPRSVTRSRKTFWRFWENFQCIIGNDAALKKSDVLLGLPWVYPVRRIKVGRILREEIWGAGKLGRGTTRHQLVEGLWKYGRKTTCRFGRFRDVFVRYIKQTHTHSLRVPS